MHKRTYLLLAIIFLFASMPILVAESSALTIPTRTPTPQPGSGGGGGGGGNPPVNPPGGGGGGGGGSNPAPTTPAVQPTAQATAPVVNIAPTPDGGFVPTAAPCSTAPTVEALSQLNVRSGPGTNFDVVSNLVFLETRPILGRASNAEWWYISLADGSEGWVADFTVTVQGFTGFVPFVPAPNGSVDGPAWNPTPQAGCETVEPPTATPVPTETAVPATIAATNTPDPTIDESEDEAEPTVEAANEPTATATSESDAAVVAIPPEATTNAVSADGESATVIEGGSGSVAPPTAIPLDIEPAAGGSSALPIAGGGLLLAGAAGWFFLRQRDQGEEVAG